MASSKFYESIRSDWRATLKNEVCKLVAFAAFLVFIVGCTSEDIDGISVSGSVTYQENPIEDGKIVFRNEGRVVSAKQEELLDVYARILAGEYRIGPQKGLVAGSYRVEIYSPQKTGRMITDPDEPELQTPEIRELLPAKYNEMTELERHIDASTTELSFDLE